jgi:N-acetylneuraminic acid mutarotase
MRKSYRSLWYGLALLAISSQASAQAGTWVEKAPMPTNRATLAAATVNGVIYAIGGYNLAGGFTLMNANEAYDPATNTWATRAPMPTARYAIAAAASGGVVYVAGGNNGGTIRRSIARRAPGGSRHPRLRTVVERSA